MGGRPFPSERLTEGLKKNFLREITNGVGLKMLEERVIGASPNFFSVQAAHIDPCLTDEQKCEASGCGLSVIGLNVNGKEWKKLQLRKKNGTYFFSEETGNPMTVANGWAQGTTICIWGAPAGKFRGNGKVRFLFTREM